MGSQSTFIRIVAFVMRVLLRMLYRVEVRGQLILGERTLIIANHESFVDGLLLGAFLPVAPTYLVHTTIADIWYFRQLLRAIPYVVVDTTKPIAIKTLVNLVDSGHPVVIFPEGRITVTGNLMKIYDGPAFVAAKTGCNVVPIHLEGPGYTPVSKMSGDFPRKLFPRIRLTINPPVKLPMPEGKTAKERRRKASERMRRILQESAVAARRPTTIFEALLDSVALHGRKRKVLEDINTNLNPVPYKMILRGSLALGRLVSRLTTEGEIVGIMMPNANATVYLLFGMFATRRVPAMLNFTSGADGVQNACRVAGIRLVLTSRAFIEKANLGDLVARLTDVRLVYLEDLRAQFSAADKLWLIAWALPNPRRVLMPVKPHDPAVVLFTSGSEGVPKGVVLSHDSILANIKQQSSAFSFSSKDKFMTALPLFHAFGLTTGMIMPLLKGCKVVLYPSPLHYRVVPEFVYDHDCTVLFTTNTFLAKYAKVAHPFDFYSLRYLVVGAEKLTEDVRHLCIEKFGVCPYEGYGATECSPVIAVNTPLAHRNGTVGEILPGMQYKLTPVPGIEDGGLLHIKGDNVMLGYLKHDQPGKIQPVSSADGEVWYETGDVVSVEDNFITIRARLKRFAKVAGEMVSLEMVERIAADALPAGVHAAATYKDPARGEAIVLFTESTSLNREELKTAARRMGAPELALPRRIVRLDKIPLLGNGKKDYVTLSKLAQEHTGREEVHV